MKESKKLHVSKAGKREGALKREQRKWKEKELQKRGSQQKRRSRRSWKEGRWRRKGRERRGRGLGTEKMEQAKEVSNLCLHLLSGFLPRIEQLFSFERKMFIF